MKKLNLKLTACLVSLFVSIILLILGSTLKNNYCLCFGLVFAAFAIICYSYNEYVKLQEKEKILKEEALNDDENYLYIAQTLKEIKKQRKTIIWGGFAFSILVIILGIACVI